MRVLAEKRQGVRPSRYASHGHVRAHPWPRPLMALSQRFGSCAGASVLSKSPGACTAVRMLFRARAMEFEFELAVLRCVAMRMGRSRQGLMAMDSRFGSWDPGL